MANNQPIFIDVDVTEQTLELRSYLKALGAEISEENNEKNIMATDLLQIVEATDVCWKEISNDIDIETVYNGIISLVISVASEENEEIILRFCEKITKPPPGDKRGHIRLKALSNLFYGLPEHSTMRYTVYCSMIKLASQMELLQLLCTDLSTIKQWISKWDISVIKIQNLLRLLHDAMVDAKIGDATKVMIELLGTYTEDNASQARDDAHRCIVTCLGDANTFLMDHLLSLKPVKFLEGELIHDLLSIFVSGKLSQYHQFYKNNTHFVNSIGLSHEQNMRKMRLLTFMLMAENRTEIDFRTLEQEMELTSDDIEDFIIDVIRTKAVRAKIDHMQKKILISSTTHRTFGKQHWQLLRQSLCAWRTSLGHMQTSLQAVDIMATNQ